MRKKRSSGFTGWPSWRYGPNGESGIFQSEAEVPYGWTRKPGEEFITRPSTEVLDRDELMSRLKAKDIDIHPAWGTAHMKRMLDDLGPTG